MFDVKQVITETVMKARWVIEKLTRVVRIIVSSPLHHPPYTELHR
jgi:hypothetical protein